MPNEPWVIKHEWGHIDMLQCCNLCWKYNLLLPNTLLSSYKLFHILQPLLKVQVDISIAILNWCSGRPTSSPSHIMDWLNRSNSTLWNNYYEHIQISSKFPNSSPNLRCYFLYSQCTFVLVKPQPHQLKTATQPLLQAIKDAAAGHGRGYPADLDHCSSRFVSRGHTCLCLKGPTWRCFNMFQPILGDLLRKKHGKTALALGTWRVLSISIHFGGEDGAMCILSTSFSREGESLDPKL